MCFSRTSNTEVGYQYARINDAWKTCVVRLELDSDKLNALFKAHPINYFIDDNDKKINADMLGDIKKPEWLDKEKEKKPKWHDSVDAETLRKSQEIRKMPNINNVYHDEKATNRQRSYEYEDRLLSKTNVIRNASNFIKRIDILISKDFATHGKLDSKRQMLGDIIHNNNVDINKINIYNNINDFNRMSMNVDGALKKNLINDVVFNNKNIKGGYDASLRDNNLTYISYVLSFCVAYNAYGYEEKVMSYLIDKYGLSDYKNVLLEKGLQAINKMYNDYSEQSKSLAFVMSRYKNSFKTSVGWRYRALIDQLLSDFYKYLNINDKTRNLYLSTLNRLMHNLKITSRYSEIVKIISYNENNDSYSNFLHCVNKNVEDIKTAYNDTKTNNGQI